MVRRDPDATKKYNRDRAAHLYEEYRSRRDALIELMGGACELCGATDGGHGLHLHHIEYDDIESDYEKTAKSMSVRMKRLAEAEHNRDRFALLCPGCHRRLEGVKWFSDHGISLATVCKLAGL